MNRLYPLIMILSLIINSSFCFADKGKYQTPKQSQQTKLSESFTAMNTLARKALHEVIRAEPQQLGAVIVSEAGALKLFRNGKQVASFPIPTPLEYHQLKVFGHMTLALVIQLQRNDWTKEARDAWLESFLLTGYQVQNELTHLNIPRKLRVSQSLLIRETLNLAHKVQKLKSISQELIRSYGQKIVPLLNDGFRYSAQAHIDIIHKQGRALYALLSEEERQTVRAYNYGGRGARVDNLILQYLSWLVGEGTGKESLRVIFSEGITDAKQAQSALARYSVETRIADLIFSIPQRLYRDVLGDATRDYLKTFLKVSEAFADVPPTKNPTQ